MNEYIKIFEFSPFGLPKKCGVYGIFGMKNFGNKLKLLYIGSSKNIQKRLYNSNHIYRKLLNKFKNTIVSVGFIETKNYIPLEIDLIKKYTPIFNRKHKNVA